MSYTESQLLPGEHLKYQAQLHWLPFLPGYILGGLMLIGAVGSMMMSDPSLVLAAGLGAVAAGLLFWTWITHTTSEFSVTDKRVIIKVGWIRRRTLETLLGKVEGIGVEQTLAGRMLNFGTIVVSGTGGTKETFRNIADPLEFRRHVQAEVTQGDDARRTLPASAASATRDERECPYCAELILKKARVCKHCQRDVEPVVDAP